MAKQTLKSKAKSKKKPQKKNAPAAPKSSAAASNLPAVRVRMYRQGLGDCFLITFDHGGDEKHMLIDCGTLGAKTTGASVEDVVRNIAAVTDPGKKKGALEILVATHAHKDHVSGFRSEKELFSEFKIENIWMPWTEDPKDKLAKQLGNTATAIRNAIAKAHALPHASATMRQELEGVAEFEDGQIIDGQLAMGTTIADALDILRNIPGAKTTYHSPATPVIELPTIPGFRFYVLGPPRDAAKLANTGDHGVDGLYGLARALNSFSLDPDLGVDDETPFDRRYCYPIGEAEKKLSDYANESESYRRIDAQWMQDAADLAAKLDNFRNNTSLALAIERIGDGRVLLFPADAQLGNWLSWHDDAMQWKVPNAAGTVQTVTATDLLARTVFYKVGHHSSHNATAKGKGLEIMRNSKELTAFIPVDRQVALSKSPKGSWRMPAVKLYRELLEACDGRVVRADIQWADDAKKAVLKKVEEELLGIATEAEWKQWQKNQSDASNVTFDKLHIDYVLD